MGTSLLGLSVWYSKACGDCSILKDRKKNLKLTMEGRQKKMQFNAILHKQITCNTFVFTANGVFTENL